MSTCRTESFTLTLPDEWADRSMITWVAPPSANYQVLPNLLCSRGELQQGETLDGFVNRQLRGLMAQVRNFDLMSRQNVEFGGRPAVELVFAMTPQSVVLKQRQLFFQADPDGAMVDTVVATAARENFDELASVFESIFQSVSWN
ncbi:hypothetical protein SAMN04487972_10916 [Paracoccus halophilus]|uniref:DUF1795 domain-containing protein n=1 Tax=Paracoccus halophilus TaxID=376733 RepID=A0A099F0K7_9RHOB|nr:DcrB-related protein [Paracoccus halophilus]KGJ04220.1 hypothetical protein IT41_11005 [Paracoccus halophilus]SFA51898.1 hypothetical protein SAMN04487972_10916 [Paracoccus halophilus]